jgi:2-polyprenyl-3-methyl-5-hydroxy-6-metoxy-1,4-benzoquinol methylase
MSAVQDFWETFYTEGRGRWSGRVNTSLAAEAADLPPGRALDLGCGQGADAIWLAQRGWTVTGIDVSSEALRVAAAAAQDAGVADAVTWERRDLADGLPPGPFDLVTSAYLHSPVELPRAAILGAAAAVVAPGGTLLTIAHARSPEHHDVDLPTLEEVRAELARDTAGWEVVTSELRAFDHAFADGPPKRRVDVVVRLRRPEDD